MNLVIVCVNGLKPNSKSLAGFIATNAGAICCVTKWRYFSPPQMTVLFWICQYCFARDRTLFLDSSGGCYSVTEQDSRGLVIVREDPAWSGIYLVGMPYVPVGGSMNRGMCGGRSVKTMKTPARAMIDMIAAARAIREQRRRVASL